MIALLQNGQPFPSVTEALQEPNGLLAAGGDLSPERLLEAYRHGIFPWFNEEDPILWWSPDPRMVLFPEEFRISRSLRKTLLRKNYMVCADGAFEQVMRACAAPRIRQHGSSQQATLPAPEGSASPCQGGTWIHEEMIAAYGALYRMGYAHSIEVWMPKSGITDELELAGGVYGVAIGKMFYGESMFSRRTDASKIALAHLAAQLARWDFGMIDCQMYTPHLASLGAHEIPRTEFVRQLQELIHYPERESPWEFEHDLIA